MKRIEKLKILALALLIVLGNLAHHGGALAGIGHGDSYRGASADVDPGQDTPDTAVHRLFRAACGQAAAALPVQNDDAALFDI